jgi:hypothetical protein
MLVIRLIRFLRSFVYKNAPSKLTQPMFRSTLSCCFGLFVLSISVMVLLSESSPVVVFPLLGMFLNTVLCINSYITDFYTRYLTMDKLLIITCYFLSYMGWISIYPKWVEFPIPNIFYFSLFERLIRFFWHMLWNFIFDVPSTWKTSLGWKYFARDILVLFGNTLKLA